LSPGGKFAAIVDDLSRFSRKENIALVGHEPDLGELAAALLGAQRALLFRKGGICRIDVDRLGSSAMGSLIWFLPPKVLRKAGR